MTPYQEHKSKWQDCRRCGLCETRNRVVLARGQVPAQVLCVAEAPGKSEDILGQPLVGPAGHLFDNIVSRAKVMAETSDLRIAYTNLVACIPLDENNEKTEEPPDEAIVKCAPRLREFVQIVKPKLIVTVGTLAADYLINSKNLKRNHRVGDVHPMLGMWQGQMVSVIHPAAILRANTVQKDLMIKKAVVTLANGFKEV